MMYILRASRRSCSFAASFGPCMLPAHAGKLQAVVLGADRDAGALEVARIGTAAHGEGSAEPARDLAVRVEQGANRRAVSGDAEGLLGTAGDELRAKARRMGSADHGHLIGGGGVGVTDVDGLKDVTVRDLNRTGVQARAPKASLSAANAEALPAVPSCTTESRSSIGALRGIKQVGLSIHNLVQVARHERDGVLESCPQEERRVRRYPGRRCAPSPRRHPRA